MRIAAVVFLVMQFIGMSVAQSPHKISNADVLKAHSLVGLTVYACASSRLWKDASTSGQIDWSSEMSPYSFPRMVPAKIARTEVTGGADGVPTLAIEIVFPNGVRAVAISYVPTAVLAESGKTLLTSLQRYGQLAGLYPDIPAFVKNAGMQRIQSFNVSRGMPAQAVQCALGNPEKQNDLGLAGEQWVFDNGKLMVYIHDGRVVDVQRFE